VKTMRKLGACFSTSHEEVSSRAIRKMSAVFFISSNYDDSGTESMHKTGYVLYFLALNKYLDLKTFSR